MPSNRRQFVQSVAASVAFSPFLLRGADEPGKKYKTALIGTGWWGMNILGEAVASGECKVVAMCDVDANQLDAAITKLKPMTADDPKRYSDFRELLEKEKPEIVIVATPDHWHPLIMIAAVKAGAHVYVEKPVGHTIKEGRAMVTAARDAGRVVQVGTHRRVSPHNVSGMEFLKSGKAGKIGMVRAFVHYPGGKEEAQPNGEAPKGLDWDMWCGPGPTRPYNSIMHPKGFRQMLDYGNGTLGDWGIHWMDQILWWTEEKYPKRISTVGGRYVKGPAVNDGKSQTTDAPDTQITQFEFESFSAVWEHRTYAENKAERTNIGCYFYGTEGTFHMGWMDGWTFYPTSGEKIVHTDPQLNKPDDQNIKELWADFLRCIKNGKRPVSDIEIGHRSTNMSLLGMLSLKLGRSVSWDGEREQVVGDEAANKLLKREYRSPWTYPA
jgi:predicted dehydrogenase